MNVNTKYLKDENGEVISPITSASSVYLDYGNKITLSNIVPACAGSHNCFYRGKDITDLYYNGELTEQISNGTFEDIFIR